MVYGPTTVPDTQDSQITSQRSSEVVLSIHNLSKQYGQRMAVNNLNLELHKGDIFGFLGPNGAGKTTTIRMVLGLITPTTGEIQILGKELKQHRAQVLPRVGALIETPALYLYMSGRDNLRAIGDSLGGVSKYRIDEILELVGLTSRQKDKVKTYSLGMKQRLGIAISLLQDPDVVILDEPANGLDPAGIVEMRDLMHQLSAEGKTVLISSHLLSEIRLICTRIAIIARGSLIRETTIDELLQGEGQFNVQLENAQSALQIVKEQPWGRNAYVNDKGALVTLTPTGKGRDLNLFLVQAGFAPDALTPTTKDLEKIFLELTNSEAGE
ncbi:ABC transporter ATP-binding protein [Dictyobacter arantiisoli]|uniref:ABC transporter ATP-binding protein n=1 Tax=Dictyobacter arantiisoli TaxID=2014874 RepID=A0A5A5TG34_9CHLR|nr:ABC transporter ATP-binding protein [Dictyobacter arantiisoli]GCF10327.1 ABC transporter ATP-binding protein [Dictyobacter arantiisoli]